MSQLGDGNPGENMIVQVDAEIEDIIPVFLEEMLENITAIKEAVEQSDYEAIHLLGHRSKGTAGSYGFDAIVEISRSVELAAKAQNLEEVRNLADQLGNYLEHIEVVFE